MKLLDTLLLSASVGFFVIGLNETFTRTTPNSFSHSYWVYMLSLLCLLLYQIRKVLYAPPPQIGMEDKPKTKPQANSKTSQGEAKQKVMIQKKAVNSSKNTNFKK